jgi:hypothetical protein
MTLLFRTFCLQITMTQSTCKGVKQINNRISLNMTFTFTICISQCISSAREFQMGNFQKHWSQNNINLKKHYTNIPCGCGQYTRIFFRGTLNCMDVLYCPMPTAEGNITQGTIHVNHKPTSLSPINCQSVDNCCIIINTLINQHEPIYL